MNKKEIDNVRVRFDTLLSELLQTMNEKEDLLSNRVMEISMGVNGTISTAPYENWKPGFGMKVNTEGLTKEQIREAYLQGKAELKGQFNLEKNNCRAEAVSEKFKNIGFTIVNNIAYVWITSVCNYDKIFMIPEFELNQYSSRGKIIHELIYEFIKTKKWIENITVFCEEKGLIEDLAIIQKGNLKLSIEDCSYKKVMENCIDKIEEPEFEVEVINDEHLYKGRADFFCKWEKIPTVVDIKVGSARDMMQLGAEAVCKFGTQKMVIIPAGESDTKQGYSKPIENENVTEEFKRFIKKRDKFFKKFGF
jgi:hypothetical protein